MAAFTAVEPSAAPNASKPSHSSTAASDERTSASSSTMRIRLGTRAGRVWARLGDSAVQGRPGIPVSVMADKGFIGLGRLHLHRCFANGQGGVHRLSLPDFTGIVEWTLASDV